MFSRFTPNVLDGSTKPMESVEDATSTITDEDTAPATAEDATPATTEDAAPAMSTEDATSAMAKVNTA